MSAQIFGLDFCLDTTFGALEQEKKEDETAFKNDDTSYSSEQGAQHSFSGVFKLRGQTQLLETIETDFPIIISIGCEE